MGSVVPCEISTERNYFAVGTDKKVYNHYYIPKLDRWQNYCGPAVTIVESGLVPGLPNRSPDRFLFGLGMDKKIYLGMWHTGSYNRSWKCITGELRVKGFFVEPLTQTIYGLGERDGAIYTCKIRQMRSKDVYCSPWVLLIKGGIPASFIVLGDEIYAVRRNNQVWHHKKNGDGTWRQYTRGRTRITQVEVWQNSFYGLGVDTKVYHWNGRKWNPKTPGGVTQFVLSGNFIHGLLKDKQIWRIPRVSGADKWQYVTRPAVNHVARPYGYIEGRLSGHM